MDSNYPITHRGIRVKVLNLDLQPDSQNEVFDAEGVTLDSPVVVYDGWQRGVAAVVGQAFLTKEHDGVYAEIIFLPELTGPSIKLFPAVGGALMDAETDKNGVRHLKKCLIKEICVSSSPNADERIRTISVPTRPVP